MTLRRAPGIAALFLVLATQAYALPLTIWDNYWGGTPTHNYAATDRIGDIDLYEITKMIIDSDASGNMLFTIYGSYFDNVGSHGTTLGDLFISTNGWNPNDNAANYRTDNYYTNGEDWEYVLAFNDRNGSTFTGHPGSITPGSTGSLSLYAINDNDILLSDYFFGSSGYIYRGRQEVMLNPTSKSNLPVLAGGTWSLFSDRIELTLSGYNLNSSNLGFHWGMTCANDVIEGGVNLVPEPATVALMGIGLIGMGIFHTYRQKRTRKA